MKEVYHFLDTLNIEENDVLIVGVSYGPDSMFLLNLLKNRFSKSKLVCAHVHHNHRKESDDEALKLERYCIENKITFEMMKIDSYTNNKFTEEEARKKRYEFFDNMMLKYKSKYLFTAHHGDDLCETILMRLTRGSNISGYSGIKPISFRNNYEIVRPLLYLTKNEIENVCIKQNIPFAVDKSNESNLYTRNRYRNGVLRLLKEENINVHKKFLQFSNELQTYESYVEKQVNKEYLNVVKEGILFVNEITKLDELIKLKIIERYLFEEYGKEIKDVSSKHVSNIMKVIESSKKNITISMPHGKTIVKSYNKLYFDKKDCYNSYCYVFDDYLELSDGYIKEIDMLENKSNYVTALNSKELTFPLYVRSRIDGDKIEVLGLNGTKKIKDIFIDEKVDFRKRDTYPILVDSKGKVLWIPGLKKSKYDKSKTGNYDIILKYYKEEK